MQYGTVVEYNSEDIKMSDLNSESNVKIFKRKSVNMHLNQTKVIPISRSKAVFTEKDNPQFEIIDVKKRLYIGCFDVGFIPTSFSMIGKKLGLGSISTQVTIFCFCGDHDNLRLVPVRTLNLSTIPIYLMSLKNSETLVTFEKWDVTIWNGD